MADPIKQAEQKDVTPAGVSGAKVLPPGSAPASKTHQPNPVAEVPGQAANELADRQHGKEKTATPALDMPGSTSADVHAGMGHPGSGQSSNELKQAQKERVQTNKGPGEGGSGMTDEGGAEARRLQEEHSKGPLPDRVHNANVAGSESVEPPTSERVASKEI